jgi:hypothetical protein
LTTSVNSSEEGIVTPAGTNWFNQGRRVSVFGTKTIYGWVGINLTVDGNTKTYDLRME